MIASSLLRQCCLQAFRSLIPIIFFFYPPHRKTFGFQTLTANLFLYLLFVIPLTVLAIFIRANEKDLCGINETWKRKVVKFGYYHFIALNFLIWDHGFYTKQNGERLHANF